MDKIGCVVEQEDVVEDMDDLCYWGILLEFYVVVVYQCKIGCKVCKVNVVLQYFMFFFLFVNFDWEIVGDFDVQIFECKIVGEFGV